LSHSLIRREFPSALGAGILVFSLALVLRLMFALATGNTYDYDEFVLLLLARDFSHGAIPYSQFMFFHPPGALLLLRAIEPLTAHWWPAARILMLVVDSCTALFVFRIGNRVFDERTGIVAAAIYAFSPLALISAVRVGQDPLITFLLVLGLTVLVERESNAAGILAGVFFALAVWVKYPALAFLPVYLVLAKRRIPFVLAGAVVAMGLLVLPFLGQFHALIDQTIQFQQARWKMKLSVRLETAVLWWLLVSPLAVLSLACKRPLWLKLGFVTGGVFLLASQVYYHYFVPVVPFAVLLAAPLLVRWIEGKRAVALGLALTVTAIWILALNSGGPSPLFVTAAHLSDVRPTVHILDRRTGTSDPVLADRFEYAYLARRPALDDYFWNIGVLVNARYLERRVSRASAVVMSYGASSGFPRGFSGWLDRRYGRVDTGSTTVWLTRHPVAAQ
jgi:4-amino-4-deoxy-L-arabinose transferase-like glycosyltransferase